jgi:signal transduction histidine kinase
MNLLRSRLALATLCTGVLLIAIFASTAFMFRAQLRADIHQKIIERDAAVLYLVAEAQLREAEADPNNHAFVSEMLLSSVLKAVKGMRAVVIYDIEGNALQTSTGALIQTDLAPDDFARLSGGEHLSRYDPDFPVGRFFTDERAADPSRTAPMLEVLLPLHAADSGQAIGFVKYLINAAPLERELGVIDLRINRETLRTLGIGCVLITVVLLGASLSIARAQRIIAERNERLTKANFELTLAAKTSALGVITSHLIHGLQGPVAGLRAVVADHAEGTEAPESVWQSAATYTERMQAMIHETVALLGDTRTETRYELTAEELGGTIRERNTAAAIAKGVILTVTENYADTIDSHRGSLICLIATNLVQNAIEATDPGRHVRVALTRSDGAIRLVVRDEGGGIPDAVRQHLFEPGRTGRVGGTGLGLAISQLLARQIGATLELQATSAQGTTFSLVVPLS